ncbi:MAG: hypothetical protein QGG64_09530, partial [Candidatus Latescibacteria bacterium]|nr:hypothetical protein [Candidatus Latescibacterota bacterium]
KSMFASSSNTFLTGETPDIDLSKADKDINLGERLVRRLVIEHLTLNPQQDLPASLALISIIHDVERIGDYTKSLEELSNLRPPIMPNGSYADMCRDIQADITPLFEMTLVALRESDVDTAKTVMQNHRAIKKQTDDLLQTAMKDENIQKDTLFYSVGSRFLRRISAHLSNIASSIPNAFDQLGRNE